MFKKIYICLLLMTLSLQARADISHRAGVQLGGMYLVMGYGISPGVLYQMTFHRHFALEINGNYNFAVFALGQGPTHSGGLDFNFQAMLYNFGKPDFSKGFGVGIGGGVHYLADFHESFETEKGIFLVVPINLDFFYQHLFDNNWFIKTGIKGYVAQFAHQIKGREIHARDIAKLLPSIYFDLGYSF